MIVERRLPRNSSTTSAASSAPTTRCSSTCVCRRADLDRVVADDVDASSPAAASSAARRPRPSPRRRPRRCSCRTACAPTARSPARRCAPRPSRRPPRRRSTVGDVAHADRVVALLAHDDVADLRRPRPRGPRCAASCSSGRSRADRPGTLTFAGRDRALDLERRHAGRGEPDRIEVDVDLALLAAEDHDLADAVEALDALLDLLVGEPRQLARRHALRALDRQHDDRRRVGIRLAGPRDGCPAAGRGAPSRCAR